MSPALAERRQRVSVIRRRIVATSLTTFAVAWAVIFFQLVIGDDPGLAHKATKTTATTSTTQSSSNASSTSSKSHQSSSTIQTSSSDNTSPAPAPVTTAQS